MAGEPEEAPIRIVKKKGGHAGHHGGAWKVAYADFVTAMMALFIVLWIVGQSKQVKESVANYFKDPGAFFESTKGSAMSSAGGKIGAGEPTGEELLKRQEEHLQQVGQEILKDIAKQPGLAELSKQIRIEVVKEGLRIELMESPNSVFFDVGTANMHEDTKKLLGVIAEGISNIPNHVILEGHTDSRSYGSALGYTNFELSTDRANSARRVLVAAGLAEGRFDEVRGYADTKLRNPADPLDAANRRISIILKFVGKIDK